MGLDVDNNLYTWGDNDNHIMLSGSMHDIITTPTILNSPDGNQWVNFSTNGNTYLAVTSTNEPVGFNNLYTKDSADIKKISKVRVRNNTEIVDSTKGRININGTIKDLL